MKFLQNSTALQQDLSEQLAQMATQLKRNAMHFSESLAKDQVVVEAAQEKIVENYDVMVKERSRLRDHRGKSGHTTRLVMLSLLVVVVSFIFMFFIIRLT
jgi:SNARE protein 1